MKNYTVSSRLVLANAILGVLFCVPTLGMFINPSGILDIVILLISIFILVKGRGNKNIKKLSSILMIFASGINLIGVMAMISAVSTQVATNSSAEATAGAVVGAGIGGSVFGIVSWIIRIIAVVFAFIEYNKLSKLASESKE